MKRRLPLGGGLISEAMRSSSSPSSLNVDAKESAAGFSFLGSSFRDIVLSTFAAKSNLDEELYLMVGLEGGGFTGAAKDPVAPA